MITNLSPDVDEAALHRHFDFAECIKSILVVDQGDADRLVGLLEIDTTPSVANVLANRIDGRFLLGRRIKARALIYT